MASTVSSSLNSELLEAALKYARQGWRVLPLHNLQPNGSWCSCGHIECRPGGKHEKSIAKHPLHGNWQNEATANEEIIRAWWRQWPRANIGIATGAGSGIVVLDVDVHRDAPGFASLEVLETFLGKLPKTRTAVTGSGGEHRLFRYPAGLAICNSAGWRGAAGIDWRGDGGQIVVAPSIALAGQYHWTDLTEPVELPPMWFNAHREHEASRGLRAARTLARASKTSAPADVATDDRVLVDLNAAGNAEKFNTLWAGKWEQAGYESQSNADLALCSIIAFWCDSDEPAPDSDRIDRLFRRSGLYRDKWEREDYRTKTIDMAVELEESRRSSDASLREHIFGFGVDDEVEAEKAKLLANSAPLAPHIPMPPSISAGEVNAKVRQIVRKKRNSKSVQAKLDGDATESFMAGEQMVSEAEIARTPALSMYRGEAGLKRVAWLLGNLLPVHIPWETVLSARPATQRAPQNAVTLANVGKVYTEAQIERIKWDQQKEAEKQAFKERVDTYFKTRASK